MPTLEIITIGTELLLGEIQDTNSTYIARTLRDHGIDIYRITTIGDNANRIASAIKEALGRAEIIITTGGLGPTIDDPTRQAVAMAADRELVFLPTLWDQILERFKAYGHEPTDNNRRQAYIPEDAIPIHNPVGTAPCFIVEIGDACVVSLPGVPSEMKLVLHQSIIPFLSRKFELKTQIIQATVLHAASIGESAIDEKIGDLEKYANPTVGLLAHPGQVDIRVTAKAPSAEEASALSQPVIDDLLDRLGNNIYGRDAETLQSVVADEVNHQGLSLGVVEYGLDGTLVERVESAQPKQFKSFIHGDLPEDLAAFEHQVAEYAAQLDSDICLGVALLVEDGVTVYFVIIDNDTQTSRIWTYGGPKDHAPLWSQNVGLDLLRRHLEKASL
ncbi:competence/damage-inducible protein A [bacterium]|nr:competence/damage-inducible protein A [bacterium]